MVYFVSERILVQLCSDFQDKFSSCATEPCHELTCLQCWHAIVCDTFQIKGSQDGQCLRDAGSCGWQLCPLGWCLEGFMTTAEPIRACPLQLGDA